MHRFVPEALAKRFASQCGFCTPGIAVAMAAAVAAALDGDACAVPFRAGDPARAAAIANGLDGNLCRCTGLRPIIDACRVSSQSSLNVLDMMVSCRAVRGCLLSRVWRTPQMQLHVACSCSVL